MLQSMNKMWLDGTIYAFCSKVTNFLNQTISDRTYLALHGHIFIKSIPMQSLGNYLVCWHNAVGKMLENGKWLLLPFSQISSYPFADNNSGCKQWCLTSRETIRLIRDEKSGGEANEGGGGGRLYTCHYTVTTRMTSALRWTVMRAILMFHNCEGQSHKTMSTDHYFWRERRAEADSNQGPSAYQPNTLKLDQTGSHWLGMHPRQL